MEIDLLLGDANKYIQGIKLTKNSFISIVNSAGDLIATGGVNIDTVVSNRIPQVSDLKKIPWLEKSLLLYHELKSSPFIFEFAGEDYIAAYEKIFDIKSEHDWLVAIVTPIDDVVAPLRKNMFIGALFTLFTLIIGVVLAVVFASSLSRPIKKLAYDANLICRLQLENISGLVSRVTEICNMAEAFMRMRNALYSFQRYMPIALVKKLIISNKIAAVGGEAKTLTLLFTDIQDFTKLSEGFSPEELMKYLSDYFQSITKIIIDMSGTVDKYIGDGLMVFWGAPIDDEKHAFHACRAAIAAKKALDRLNIKWAKENKPQLKTRFGINSGHVVVGNVGSDERLNYTALGDPVNLASRLEGLSKIYGTTIIVSEYTYNLVKDDFKFRLLDRVAVKGKKNSVYIYELLGELDELYALNWEQYNQDFSRAFLCYESGDWKEALDMFNALESRYYDDQVIKLFRSRCLVFLNNPPTGWNGVWSIEE